MQGQLSRLVEIAAQAQSRFGDDELEQFAVEYWARRGVNYPNDMHKYTLDELYSLEVNDENDDC